MSNRKAYVTPEECIVYALEHRARCKYCPHKFDRAEFQISPKTKSRLRNHHPIVMGEIRRYRSLYFLCGDCGNITFWEQAMPTTAPLTLPDVEQGTLYALQAIHMVPMCTDENDRGKWIAVPMQT